MKYKFRQTVFVMAAIAFACVIFVGLKSVGG